MPINHLIQLNFQLNAIAGKYVLNEVEKMNLCHSMRAIQLPILMRNIFNYLFIYPVEYFEVSIFRTRFQLFQDLKWF